MRVAGSVILALFVLVSTLFGSKENDQKAKRGFVAPPGCFTHIAFTKHCRMKDPKSATRLVCDGVEINVVCVAPAEKYLDGTSESNTNRIPVERFDKELVPEFELTAPAAVEPAPKSK